MLFRSTALAFLLPSLASGFVTPVRQTTTTATARYGYLDDLSKELYAPDGSSSREEVDTGRMNMDKEQIDRYGVGTWDDYVEFNEFDGGDGQMGVAGDGQKGLEKEWTGAAEMGKSKTMSAKNAWGKSTGYADSLIEKGVEATRAQQMENWKNQQEVLEARKQHRWMTESFDPIGGTTADESWRDLSKYGAERNQAFDLDQEFGAVTPGEKVYHHIELTSRIGQPKIFEFDITVSSSIWCLLFSLFRLYFHSIASKTDGILTLLYVVVVAVVIIAELVHGIFRFSRPLYTRDGRRLVRRTRRRKSQWKDWNRIHRQVSSSEPWNFLGILGHSNRRR